MTGTKHGCAHTKQPSIRIFRSHLAGSLLAALDPAACDSNHLVFKYGGRAAATVMDMIAIRICSNSTTDVDKMLIIAVVTLE